MQTKKKQFVSLVIAALFLVTAVNGISITTAGDDILPPVPPAPSPDGNETVGNITAPFLELTRLAAAEPVVYVSQDNILYLEISSTAGSIGDENYTSNISQAIDDIEVLIDENEGNPKVILLGKAVDELEEALGKISDGKRVDTIDHILKAIVFLNAASKGHNGIDTKNIVTSIANSVKEKVGTVIEEAEMSFGSASPDVTLAKLLYDQAIDKLEMEKYPVAMGLFEAAFETVLNAYECDAHITIIDLIPDVSETEIGNLTFNNLEAEEEDTGEIVWHPTEVGVHYIKVIMSGEYEVYSSPATTVESPSTIISVGFPVAQPPDEEFWLDDDALREIIKDDPDTPTTFPTADGLVCHIHVLYGDLIIRPEATLTFNEQVSLFMYQPGDWPITKYSVTIDLGGTFNINGGAKTTTVTADQSTYPVPTYPFLNSGTVSF